MSAAILNAAEKNGLDGMAAQIVLTQHINGALGTNLAPWDLEMLPDEWLTALEMWIFDLPKVRAWRADVDASLARLKERNKQVH